MSPGYSGGRPAKSYIFMPVIPQTSPRAPGILFLCAPAWPKPYGKQSPRASRGLVGPTVWRARGLGFFPLVFCARRFWSPARSHSRSRSCCPARFAGSSIQAPAHIFAPPPLRVCARIMVPAGPLHWWTGGSVLVYIIHTHTHGQSASIYSFRRETLPAHQAIHARLRS